MEVGSARRGAAEAEAEHDHGGERAHLGDREHGLDAAAFLEAAGVERGERDHDDDGAGLNRAHAERPARRREDIPQRSGEGGERDGDGRDRARLDDEHERPPVEEAADRPVELRQIHVLSPRARHGGGEPPVARGARHRERAGDRPDEQEPAGRRQASRDVGRDDEDAGADHRARDERRRVDEAESRLEAVRHVWLASLR